MHRRILLLSLYNFHSAWIFFRVPFGPVISNRFLHADGALPIVYWRSKREGHTIGQNFGSFLGFLGWRFREDAVMDYVQNIPSLFIPLDVILISASCENSCHTDRGLWRPRDCSSADGGCVSLDDSDGPIEEIGNFGEFLGRFVGGRLEDFDFREECEVGIE